MSNLTKKQIDELIKKVHSGEISVFDLPEEVFLFNFNELFKEVKKGFGAINTVFKETRLNEYRLNIGIFSGAKTFNEVKDLSQFVFNQDGTKRPLKEFREFALKIDNTYNVDWLNAERDTAFGMSQSAEKWIEIEEDKDILPMLRYETVGDDRVRDEHAAWDQLVFPVDHEFWDTRMPINSWRCRCIVTQLESGRTSSLKGVPKNTDKIFNVNAGKVDFIFDPESHPYFKVEKRFKPMLKDNFGFKTP